MQRAAVVLILSLFVLAAASAGVSFAQRTGATDAAFDDLRANAAGFAALIAEDYDGASRFFARHAREHPHSIAARIGFIQSKPARVFRTGAPVVPHVERRSEAARSVADWCVLFEIAHRRNQGRRCREAIAALRALDADGVWWRYADLRRRVPDDRPEHRSLHRSGRWALVTPSYGDWRPSPALVALADPLLRPSSGALLFWHFYLTYVGTGEETEREGAKRAIADDSTSPLAPAVRLLLASFEPDGQRRWDEYESIATDFPDSPLRSHAQFRQATMLERNRNTREQAIRYFERVIDDPTGKHAMAARASLADLYVDYREPAVALDRLLELERTNAFPFHRQVIRVLLDLDEGARADARLGQWSEKLPRPPDDGTGASDAAFGYVTPSHLDFWWLLGERESAQGRFDDAFTIYHRLQRARDARQFVSLEPWNGWRLQARIWLALFRSAPFAVAGMLTLPFLWGIALAVSAIIFVARFDRARWFLPWGIGVAVVVTGMEIASGLLAGSPMSGPFVMSAGFTFLRTLLVATAGAILLGSFGVKHQPFVRALRHPRSHHGRRVTGRALAVIAGLIAIAGVSVAVAALLPHRLSPFLERMAEAFPTSDHALLTGQGAKERLLLLVCRAAITEELLFRGVLLGIALKSFRRLLRTRRHAEWFAIAFTAVAFAIPHAGMVDPDHAKMLQVGGLGVVFGAIAVRHGIGASMFLHLALNATAGLLAGPTS